MSKINMWAVRKIAAFQGRDKEEGQGLAEYGLILALIAVLCVGALGALKGGIDGTLRSVAGQL